MVGPNRRLKPAPRIIRADGYPPEIAAIVCYFQRSVERAPNCNYAALQAALLWARQTYLPITTATLRATYEIARRPSFRQPGDRDQ